MYKWRLRRAAEEEYVPTDGQTFLVLRPQILLTNVQPYIVQVKRPILNVYDHNKLPWQRTHWNSFWCVKWGVKCIQSNSASVVTAAYSQSDRETFHALVALSQRKHLCGATSLFKFRTVDQTVAPVSRAIAVTCHILNWKISLKSSEKMTELLS